MTWMFWAGICAGVIGFCGYKAWREGQRRWEVLDADLATALSRRSVTNAKPDSLLLYYVGERAECRRDQAEQDWKRLCRVVVGHEQCDCRDCDLMFEAAFDAADPAAVAREIYERRQEKENA